MAQGISPNPLNDISKAYLELVAKINKEEEDKIVQNWDTTSVNKVDPDLVLSVEEEVTRKPKREELKVTTHETFSSWRDDLREIVSEPESEAEKEVKEKKVKNKVIINPKLGEAIEEIGGTILEVSEVEEPKEKEAGISPGQACVFYSKNKIGDKVLGGGWIMKSVNKYLST